MIPAPDVEVIVADTLRADAYVTAIGAHVGTEIPVDAVFPMLRVTRFGGSDRLWGHLDLARVQIDSWADTKGEAYDLIAAAKAALKNAENTVHALGTVCAVDTVSGPTWAPDGVTDRPRYLLDMSVQVHPQRVGG